MKYLVALAVLLPAIAFARDLAPSKNVGLASTLGLLEEIATTDSSSNQPYFVRVFAIPEAVLECGGPVASCPSVKLYITASYGDLGESPVLYQLPASKGWEFIGWSKPVTVGETQMASFRLRTTLPANVSPEARKAWRSREYRVLVSPSGASYTES